MSRLLSRQVDANSKNKYEVTHDNFWIAVFGETQDCLSAAPSILTRPNSIWLFYFVCSYAEN